MKTPDAAPFTPKTAHPYANIFPMMDDVALTELAGDIKDNGQRDPIIVNDDDLIIDGRNREKGCGLAGIEPSYETVSIPERDLLAWIVSKNLHRRHLTTSQRAAVAAELANIGFGGDRASGQQVVVLPSGAQATSRASAAKALGVGVSSVNHAAAVRKASPQRHEDIKAGKVSVSTAYKEARAAAPKRKNKKPKVATTPPATLDGEALETDDQKHRAAFLIRAAQAAELGQYPYKGPVTQELLDHVSAVIAAWNDLFLRLKEQIDEQE